MGVVEFKKVKKAIIIDDSEMDGYLLKTILQMHQMAEEVIVIECPVKALDFFNSYEDGEKGYIFLDLNMPLLTGFQFLKKFNQFPEQTTGKFRVVIVSSSDSPADIRESGTFDNITGYLIKPVKPVDLEKVLT